MLTREVWQEINAMSCLSRSVCELAYVCVFSHSKHNLGRSKEDNKRVEGIQWCTRGTLFTFAHAQSVKSTKQTQNCKLTPQPEIQFG